MKKKLRCLRSWVFIVRFFGCVWLLVVISFVRFGVLWFFFISWVSIWLSLVVWLVGSGDRFFWVLVWLVCWVVSWWVCRGVILFVLLRSCGSIVLCGWMLKVSLWRLGSRWCRWWMGKIFVLFGSVGWVLGVFIGCWIICWFIFLFGCRRCSMLR